MDKIKVFANCNAATKMSGKMLLQANMSAEPEQRPTALQDAVRAEGNIKQSIRGKNIDIPKPRFEGKLFFNSFTG